MPIDIQNPEHLPSEFRIFYAWQSQCPPRINKNLIRTSLQQAIVRIEEELPEGIQLPLVLDSDTTGRAGSPDIADSIMAKIADSQIVVVDVSIVSRGETFGVGDDARAYPNPNTMVELGYAAGKHGWERVINVFNTASGRVEELPFDIRGRRITTYHCPENEDTSPAKKSLAGELYLAIATIIERIGSGQLRSECHEIERIKRSRDIIHLKEMMATIDTAVIDQLSSWRAGEECVYVLGFTDHWLLFSEMVSASRFHFYDDHLAQKVHGFEREWKNVAYLMYVCHESGFFGEPDSVDWDAKHLREVGSWSDDESFESCEQVVRSFRELLKYIHERYPEIDLRETDSLARDALRRRSED